MTEPVPELTAVTPPMLRQIWDMAPVIDLQLASGGGDKDPSEPERRGIEASSGSIMTAVEQLLRKTGPAVTYYEGFREFIRDNSDWIFAVTGPEHRGPDGGYVPTTSFDEGTAENMSQQIGSNPVNNTYAPDYYMGLTQQQIDEMKINMDNLLLAVADTIHLAGNYIAMLAAAADAYANADYNSTMPDPVPKGIEEIVP